MLQKFWIMFGKLIWVGRYFYPENAKTWFENFESHFENYSGFWKFVCFFALNLRFEFWAFSRTVSGPPQTVLVLRWKFGYQNVWTTMLNFPLQMSSLGRAESPRRLGPSAMPRAPEPPNLNYGHPQATPGSPSNAIILIRGAGAGVPMKLFSGSPYHRTVLARNRAPSSTRHGPIFQIHARIRDVPHMFSPFSMNALCTV